MCVDKNYIYTCAISICYNKMFSSYEKYIFIKQILSHLRLQTVLATSTRRLKRNGRKFSCLESLSQIMLAFIYLQQVDKMEASSHGENMT